MKPQKKFTRRAIKIPTPDYLKNAALFYLERYAASEASLRRVLQNRIRRAQILHPDFAKDEQKQIALRAAVEQIIETHKRTGVINDAAFAEMKIANLRRAGRSKKFIRQKLGARGIHADTVTNALQNHDAEQDNEQGADATETKAALTYAKRRRLGPFRPPNSKKDPNPQKDFATMARAGFPTAIIRKILNVSADDMPEIWE